MSEVTGDAPIMGRGDWERVAREVAAERDQALSNVRELLDRIEALRSAPSESASYEPEAALYETAARIEGKP